MSEPRTFRQSHWPIPAGATEILLVRHGESMPYVEGQPVKLLNGQDDPPLAPQGQIEAGQLASRLADERIDAIYVTPLGRTAETAAPLAGKLGIEVRVIDGLREIHLGEWEGGTFRQRIADADPLVLQMRAEERWDMVPGAESGEAFRARIRDAIGAIATAHPNGRVVAVTHAGTITTIVSMATGSRPFAFLATNNGAISTLIVNGDAWEMRSFNDTGHLHPSDDR